MKIWLVARPTKSVPQSRARFFYWEKSRCLLGSEASDIVLNDPLCSKWHALLYVEEGGSLRVRDLKTPNGTLVNFVPVTDAMVKVGDQIQVGQTILEVTLFEPGDGKNAAL